MTKLAMLVLVALLAACADPAYIQARRERFASSIPACLSDRECEMKWSAARTWVLGNAGMKLQHVANDFLETYNPVGNNSTLLAVRVVKEPMSGGTGYRIIVTTCCGNPFGCFPDPWAAAQNFNDYVNSISTPSAPVPAGSAPK